MGRALLAAWLRKGIVCPLPLLNGLPPLHCFFLGGEPRPRILAWQGLADGIMMTASPGLKFQPLGLEVKTSTSQFSRQSSKDQEKGRPKVPIGAGFTTGVGPPRSRRIHR